MAKHTILAAAVLAIFLLVVDASIYRTTITTMQEIGGENPSRQTSERCREQLRRQQGLSHCEQYLMQGRSWGGDEPMMIAFRRAENRNQQQQHFQLCCKQMKEIEDEECMCMGLRKIVEEKMQQGEFEGREMEMKQRAQDLPEKCGMEGMRCRMPQL